MIAITLLLSRSSLNPDEMTFRFRASASFTIRDGLTCGEMPENIVMSDDDVRESAMSR